MSAVKNLKKQVEYLLANLPETRNSDITLTIRLWQNFYGITDMVPVNLLYHLPTHENIKRFRAMFNAEGKYLADNPEVLQNRQSHRKDRKEWIELAKSESGTPGTLF